MFANLILCIIKHFLARLGLHCIFDLASCVASYIDLEGNTNEKGSY